MKNLMRKDIDSVKKVAKQFPILNALEKQDIVTIGRFLSDPTKNPIELRAVALYAAFMDNPIFVEMFLLEPAVFQNSDMFRLAQEGTFQEPINTLISKMKPSTMYDPTEMWKGISKEDLELLNTEFWENIDNKAICPICCALIIRQSGCMYIYNHECQKSSTTYSRRLHQQYKHPDRETIEVCVRCSRICKGHGHFKSSSIYNKPNSGTTRDINPYGHGGGEERACRANGGGGIREKILRIQAYIQAIVDLQPYIHRISKMKATIKIVETMWNVRITPESNRQAEVIFDRKRFIIPEMEFARNRGEERVPKAIENIIRNKQDRELLPTIENGQNEINRIMGFDGENQVIRFHHRRKDGTINTHDTTKISRENLEGELRRRLDEKKKEEELVKCWYNLPTIETEHPCTAIIHPDELLHLVNNDSFDRELYNRYKQNFNEFFTPLAGGFRQTKSKRNKRSRKTRRR